jgi:uncharacterized protein (TIGR02246 family)
MATARTSGSGQPGDPETAIRSLHAELLRHWNERDAAGFASLFTADGDVVGFDGSQMKGKEEIESSLGGIFEHHATAAYVGKVREVRLLAPEVGVLRAVVGMLPPGQADLDPKVNAIQSLVAVNQGGRWVIAHFQNTPAAFHGRPELSKRLTAELREELRGRSR